MAKKLVHIDGIGAVTLYKRRRTKTVRLSISSSGDIKISMPYWLPYKMGVDFATKKISWIRSQLPEKTIINNEDFIGREHRVHIVYGSSDSKFTTRVSSSRVNVNFPLGTELSDTEVQKTIHSACLRALKKEANDFLPTRLECLAKTHGFSYEKVSIKRMKSRWGSCSNRKVIALNIYLMQLEDDLVDYVLLHELVHTKILAHGSKFWEELSKYVENLPEIRKRMRQAETQLRPR